MEAASWGRLFSWREAKRGPEARRPERVGERGAALDEAVDETESERSLLLLLVGASIVVGCVILGSLVVVMYVSEEDLESD